MSRQTFDISPAEHAPKTRTAPPIVQDVLGSPGRPLEPGVRGPIEARFGHDFSHVRFTPTPWAAESARAVAAEAYTVGRHVAFSSGALPSLYRSRAAAAGARAARTVVQQGGGDPAEGALPVTPAGGHLETEAEQQGDAKAGATPPSVQRRVVVSPPAAATQVAKHLETSLRGQRLLLVDG